MGHRNLHLKGLSALAAGVLLFSASTTAAAAAASPPVIDDASSLTCADFNAAAARANPGKNASATDKRLAVDAQDYIANGVVWLHGYLTGHGVEAGKLTREWIAGTVEKLGKACTDASEAPATRLVDLVQKP